MSSWRVVRGEVVCAPSISEHAAVSSGAPMTGLWGLVD